MKLMKYFPCGLFGDVYNVPISYIMFMISELPNW